MKNLLIFYLEVFHLKNLNPKVYNYNKEKILAFLRKFTQETFNKGCEIMPSAIFYSDSSITLDEANPSVTWAGSPYLIVGLYYNTNPPSVYRSLLHFNIGSIPANAEIQNCILNMHVINTVDSNVQDFFTPYLVTSPWNQSTKWATQPGINYSIKGSSTEIAGIGNVPFDVTSIVKYWISSGINSSLVLKSTETVELSPKTFVSSNDTTHTDLRPFLNIQYNDPAPITVFKRRFETTSTITPTSTTLQTSPAIDVSQIFDYTIFIQNAGSNSINLTLQISPDGVNFATEAQQPISPGNLVPLVSRYLTNYIRFMYVSPGGTSNFKYWIVKQI